MGVEDSNQVNKLDKARDKFEQSLTSLDHFIKPHNDKTEEYKVITKCLYDYGQKNVNDLKVGTLVDNQHRPLESLLIKGFDYEQIWQQLDVFNQPFTARLLLRLPKLTSRVNLSLDVDLKKKTEEEENHKEIKKSILKVDKQLEPKEKAKKKVIFDAEPPVSKDNVDFFNLDEMEAFLDEQDRREMQPDDNKQTEDDEDGDEKDEEIDYFADMSFGEDDDDDEEDEDDDKTMYEDFFDPPSKKGKQVNNVQENEDDDDDDEDEEIEDDEGFDSRDVDDTDLAALNEDDQGLLGIASSDEDEENDQPKSGFDLVNEKLKSLATDGLGSDDEDDPSKSDFERAQIRLRRKITTAERELLRPAATKWQLAGEATSGTRPENSLLEEHLEFDATAKPPPTLTEQFARSLEDLIKQRIKDKVFDDVERKVKPSEAPFEFRRRIMLDSEKSKVGLAEVYEQEYLKQQEKAKEGNNATLAHFASAGEVEETETRKEIRRLTANLFRKLDALSAFHYTPRAPEPELKIVNNMPAITMEEATPVTVSDMKLLAPEEVFSTRNKKVLQAPSERSSTDKKRARRLKKKKQSIKLKMNPGKAKVTQKANTSVGKTDEKKDFTSSKKFFNRLQEINETAKVEKVNRQRPKLETNNLAKKLKL